MRPLLPPRDAALRLLAALGAVIALIGIGLDLLPSASPGLNLPQFMLIAAGVALAALALALRSKRFRQRLHKNLLVAVGITAATLVMLEILLALGGQAVYYPARTPTAPVDQVRWRSCDEGGCHFIRDTVLANCAEGSQRRMCTLNAQGFADSQPFTAAAAHAADRRLLFLGDSFTFGMSAGAGKSFVETLEARDAASIYWNAAVPGAGTHHALATFSAYAPLLQPDVTVLGFYMNDFRNNMISLNDWAANDDAGGSADVIWIDLWGNTIMLDRETALYYRQAGIEPPASGIEQVLGGTRLGTLGLRFMDAVARIKSDAEGASSIQAEITREYLQRLAAAAEAQGSALLVLLIPQAHDIASPSALFRNALHLLEALHLSYLNPREALDAQRDYAPDGHWSSAGHQKIAGLLEQCLRAFFARGDFVDCA